MSDLRGRWRNDQGWTLRVNHLFVGGLGGYHVLGSIWAALPEEKLFGRGVWLVTEEGLKANGYERVGDDNE